MKQSKLLLFLAAFIFSANAFSQDVWTMRDSVNGPGKSASTAFSIGLKGFIGFGLADNGYKRSLYAYDPIQDDWDKMESLGGISGGGLERVSPVSFVINGKAYVGLGNGNNPYFKDLWEYDPATNSWTQKADFAGTARRQAVAFAIDSLAYAGTGLDANGYTSDFWKYSPATNSWSSVAAFGGGNRKQAVGFALDDKGYVGTGDNGSFSKDFWQYDPVADSWTAIADFPGTPRYAATAIAAYPDAIVGLGYDNTLEFVADLWRYNAITDTWVQLADFPGGARSNAVGFVIQRHAYLGCGYSSNGDYLDDFYEYGSLISVDKIEGEQNLSSTVFPNPVSSECIIGIDGIHNKELSLDIHNLTGQTVTSRFGIKQVDYHNPRFRLTTSNNPEGLYFYSIKEQGKLLRSGQFTISE